MRRWPFALVVAFLAAVGCRDLPSVQAGVCGNGVVEPAAGEDCDLFPSTPGAVCEKPGAAHPCRYDCSARDDGTRPPCPGGMLCGTDGLCRWPSGTFESTPVTLAGAPREILSGDMDGDRRQDLISVERDRVVVHYFRDGLAPESELDIPSTSQTRVFPVLGELSGDALSDLIVPYGAGVVAALGSRDRSLVSTSYPTLALPSGVKDAYFIAAKVLPQLPGQQILLLIEGTDAVSGLFFIGSTGSIELLALGPAPDTLAGDVAVGNVNEDPVTSPCDELLIPVKGNNQIQVLELCKPDPTQGFVVNAGGASTAISLPSGDKIVGPLRLADFNHDGHLDAAVAVSNGSSHFIDLAYGIGDGTFQQTFHEADIGQSVPLAIGDLNDDGLLDYVDAHGVYVQKTSGWETVATESDDWSDAVIADLNGNGLPDVLAAVANRPGATFLNGAGDGHVSRFDVATEGPLSHLFVGDYDGDLIQDVAASEHVSGQSDDFLSVMFGSQSGPPESAQREGLVGNVEQIAKLRSVDVGKPEYNVDSIVSLSMTADKEIAFAGFAGEGDRQLRSPFTIVRTQGDTVTAFYSVRVAAGRFDGDAHADLAELAASVEPSGAPQEYRLWLVPMHHEAEIDLSKVESSAPLPTSVDWTQSELASGDLDGDGVAELVLLAPTQSGSGSRIFVAESVASSDGHRTWRLDAPVNSQYRFAQTDGIDVAAGDAGGGRARVADLDGDGHADVIALAPASGKNKAALVVFHGTGSKTLGPPTLVPDTPDGPATAFALIQTDRDRAIELALLCHSRVYIANADAAGHYQVAPTPVASLPGAALIGSGDFDGDGVPDLALGTASSIAVFRGVPGLP